MSTIEADEVDVPTTRIPKVESVKGGAVKTVGLKTALGAKAPGPESVGAVWLVDHVKEAHINCIDS